MNERFMNFKNKNNHYAVNFISMPMNHRNIDMI